jgi:hypothetical protein
MNALSLNTGVCEWREKKKREWPSPCEWKFAIQTPISLFA